jgi:hypothetical protein
VTNFTTLQQKNSGTRTEDFCLKNAPKSPDFEKNICEIAIFGQKMLPKHGKILEFSNFLSNLQPNLANSSCG